MRKLVATSVLTLGLATLPLTAAHAGTTWVVTMRAGTDHVVAGHRVVFTGTVRPKAAAAGQKVVLQEKFRPGKPWKDQRKATVRADGTYRVADTPTTNFTHRYRVVMPATTSHPRGVSPAATVVVYAWGNLTDHVFANGQMLERSVDMDGVAYPDSLTTYDAAPAYVEYNLDHQCRRLKATFGISDSSTSGGQAQVDAQADGTQIYTHVFDVGEKEARTLVLDSPLKLRFSTQSTSTAPQTYGLGAIGSPRVLCTR